MAARMIPKSTKVKVEFIKGFNFGDIFVILLKGDRKNAPRKRVHKVYTKRSALSTQNTKY